MKKLIVVALTLFVLSEARPGVVAPKPVEMVRSVEAEEKHLRVRRSFDYEKFMSQLWEKLDRCPGCSKLNVGNGYKNRNKVLIGTDQNSPNHDIVNIGNGAKNKNTVYIGVTPGSDSDLFKGSFWED